MDTTPRIEALRIAKGLIASHGLVAHMNKYNRDLLTREVDGNTTGLRYEYQLDPARNSWAGNNPTCNISVLYATDPSGSRLTPEGSMVVDNFLRITVSASASDMDMATFRQRESMVSMLGMLCEMLQVSLPQKLTLTMETAAEVADRKQRAFEQLTAGNILASLGSAAVRGLRRGGGARHLPLPAEYLKAHVNWPDAGTYRYRHVKSVNRRGIPKEIHFYSIRVFNAVSDCPSVSIRRLTEAP